MCGISGFLSHDLGGDAFEAVVRRMAATLQHRGPDDSGTWTDPAASVALGHQRLSVVDLTPEGHQPMVSASGRYILAFNGEIYNFPELREILEAHGHHFRGHADSEVLITAMDAWGIEPTLPRLTGMFAFAVWDREIHTLTLVRDRIGEKPLYYSFMGGSLLFGSELSALKQHPAWKGEINRGALALFMRHNYVPAPHSIYENVYKLLPGTSLTIPLEDISSRTEPKPYWSLRERAEHGITHPVTMCDDEAVEELDQLLRNAVSRQMAADVPLGAFLSGGIDSSTIVALMQAQTTTPVKTFTIGFQEAGYNEAESAKAVANHLGTEHTELYVSSRKAQSVIEKLPSLYSEPFADSSQIPTFLVSQMARKHVTVALSGDGGDELFGGYNRYFWGADIWNLVGRIPTPLRRLTSRGMTALSADTWNRIGSKLIAPLPSRYHVRLPGDKLHKLAGVIDVAGPNEMYLRLISSWKQPGKIVKDSTEPATLLTTQPGEWQPDNFSSRMMLADMLTYLPDDILVKVDRAAMGVSLETRVPMLDHQLVEFAWRVPLSMKIRDGQGKWLLRQVLHRYLPKHLIERPKMGFGIPLDNWLRGPLQEWAEDLLNPIRMTQEGFFDVAPIQEKWAEHQSGRRNWQYLIWPVLMFQAWLREQ